LVEVIELRVDQRGCQFIQGAPPSEQLVIESFNFSYRNQGAPFFGRRPRLSIIHKRDSAFWATTLDLRTCHGIVTMHFQDFDELEAR